MEMEQPQMELIGSIDMDMTRGLTLTQLAPLDQAGHGNGHPLPGMDMGKLTIAGSGNGNGSATAAGPGPSYEVVDALSFFGKKDKTPQEKAGAGSGAGSGDSEMKASDDGDAKGLWGSSGSNKAMMSVHMDSEVYNMTHPKRGRAVIFNHENFHPQLELGRRHGTERDKHNLVDTCKKLGFDVSPHDDLTYHEILEKVEKLTKEDHSKNDCLLIAVLSHGDNQLLYAKDYSYKPDMLWQSFTAEHCPSLAGKPKIFLIQACQGSQLDEGTKLVRVSRTETDSNPQSYRIPNYADFMIAFSTVPGYYSWRNTTNGSWFMQAVSEVFNKYASKKDLLAMMTIVARKVALNFESNTPSQPHMHQKKQMPFITSTLIRDVYLTPK